jgi:hypothetical protein
MRRSMSPLLVIVLVVAVSCGDDTTDSTAGTTSAATSRPTTTTVPEPPVVDAQTLEGLFTHLDTVVRAHAEAWTAQDVDAILAFYDAETVHDDSLFGVWLQGDDLFAMPQGFIDGFGDYRSRVTDVMIRPGVALVFDEGFGMTLRGVEFTEDAPMLEVDRIEVDDDGILGTWSLWYDLEMWELWGSPGFRMAIASNVLDAYEASWSSADPDVIVAMYSAGAERVDGLVGTSAVGPVAIAAVAAELAGDGVDLVPGARFSDSRKAAADVDVIGSVFELVQPDGCSIRTAVVLTVEGGLISHEEAFWDADSLVECGWAA